MPSGLGTSAPPSSCTRSRSRPRLARRRTQRTRLRGASPPDAPAACRSFQLSRWPRCTRCARASSSRRARTLAQHDRSGEGVLKRAMWSLKCPQIRASAWMGLAGGRRVAGTHRCARHCS
eukprot:2713575-Prymnesium_polylepis.1